jgi:hypothetical protein
VPPGTQTIGFRVRSLTGEELIQAVSCGARTCYTFGSGLAVVSYGGPGFDEVRVTVRLIDVPVTAAKVVAYAYRDGAALITGSSQPIAQGEASLDLRLGAIATASVSLVGPAPTVQLEEFWPTMGGVGVPVWIYARNLNPAKGSIKFGNTPAEVVSWEAGDPGVVIALAPDWSAEEQITVIDPSAGTATFPNRFVPLGAIGLPPQEIVLAAGDSKVLTASATASSGAGLPTASVTWSLVTPQSSQATSGGGTADSTASPFASPTPVPSSSPPGGGGSTPTPPAGSYLEFFRNGDSGPLLRGYSTGDEYPYRVTLRAGATGSYEIRIRSGILLATRSVTVQ